uniref:F-box domain-containing protein n=1 Tax=Lotharella oceanica TaxID=641309 RepID=A0A7S2X9M3_9EUKA|mmetsp:Transcript_16187/g.30724  ORF Transcript_16187/g.30724 Transcript_16187/m.30724 type:complete len:316 (+) Transcript_16187:64-1011(+)
MDLDEMMSIMKLAPVPEPKAEKPREEKAREVASLAKADEPSAVFPVLDLACIRGVLRFLMWEDLARTRLISRRWSRCASVEILDRHRISERLSVAAKRTEEHRHHTERRLKAFFDARAEAIEAQKERNRKMQQEDQSDRSTPRQSGSLAELLSRTTALIPPETLASAPPERMRMMVAALHAMQKNIDKDNGTPTSPPSTAASAPPASGGRGVQDAKASAGGGQASRADDLIERLIGAAVRDEDFLEAHRLKGMRKELHSLQQAVSTHVKNEEFLQAHEAKKRLTAFLDGFETRILPGGGDEGAGAGAGADAPKAQ